MSKASVAAAAVRAASDAASSTPTTTTYAQPHAHAHAHHTPTPTRHEHGVPMGRQDTGQGRGMGEGQRVRVAPLRGSRFGAWRLSQDGRGQGWRGLPSQRVGPPTQTANSPAAASKSAAGLHTQDQHALLTRAGLPQ